MITVNSFLLFFFAYWIKEIDIKQCVDDLQILPTNNPTDIYRYSDAILKHMPKDTLKAFPNTILYSKKKLN